MLKEAGCRRFAVRARRVARRARRVARRARWSPQTDRSEIVKPEMQETQQKHFECSNSQHRTLTPSVPGPPLPHVPPTPLVHTTGVRVLCCVLRCAYESVFRLPGQRAHPTGEHMGHANSWPCGDTQSIAVRFFRTKNRVLRVIICLQVRLLASGAVLPPSTCGCQLVSIRGNS